MISYLQQVLIDVSAGVAPVATTSQQLCVNLNADLLDGFHASAFATAAHTHPYLPLAGGTLTGKIDWLMSYPGCRLYPGANPTGDASDFWIQEVPSEVGINEFRLYHRDSSASLWDISYVFRADTLYLGASKFWHSGNDGHTSFLDADLLDGLHASSFALAGHTHAEYLLKAGDTATGSLAVFSSILTGPSQRNIGLRLHSDTAYGIEVHHGSSQAILVHTRSGNSIRFGAYLASATAQSTLTAFGEFGSTGGLVLGTPAGGDKGLGTLNAAAIYVQNNIGWHAGNDGSLSGLDGDLLDGQHGSYYLLRANHTGTQAWSTITATPTTLSGYGITDALAGAGANHKPWTNSDTDIDALIPGSAFGSVLESVASAHFLVGLRSNDVDDSFAVISKDAGNPTYSRLCFRVTADGRVLVGSNGVWHAGNFDPNSKADIGHLHDSRYLQLTGGALTGQLSVSTAPGVPPFVVNQTTKVTNLNADLLDGFDSTAFLRLAAGGTVNGGTTFAASLIAQVQLDVRAQAGANSSYIATFDGSPQSGALTMRSRTLAQLKADLGSMPVDPHNHDATYVRLDGGNTITGNLPFGSATRQMLNLYGTSYGIGVQSATLYLRTAQDFSVHAGGSHVNGQNSAGAGGLTLLNVSSVGNVARLFNAYDIWHTGNFNPSNYVPTSRQVLAGTGLLGGGPLTADRTISANFGNTSNTVCAGNRGLPSGGTTGQKLVKASGASYDVSWADDSAGGWGSLDFYANLVMNSDENGSTKTTSNGGLSWVANSPTISFAELGRTGSDCYLDIHIAGTQIGTDLINATSAFYGPPGAVAKSCTRIWLSGVRHNGSNLVMTFIIEGQDFPAQKFGIAGVNIP